MRVRSELELELPVQAQTQVRAAGVASWGLGVKEMWVQFPASLQASFSSPVTWWLPSWEFL